jgi:class 3 adenylate cyclase
MSQDPSSQLYRPYLPTWLRERVATQQLRPGDVTPCHATILYADLSGFTHLTAAYAALPDGAERLHDALNRCYSALIETIGAFEGDVASIAGDALTAWWPGYVDVDLARRCGAAMHAALAALPPLLTPDGPMQLGLRIGVSAGPIFATLAGQPNFGVHLVITGPALDAAARAERISPPGIVRVLPAAARVPHPPAAAPPDDAADPLGWEHFLPASFAERLRLNELVPEYRRCVPAFASFALPRRPEDLHSLVAQVQAVVARWGGWLNEIEVGDKGAVFVLLFGAPVARGDDPSRAVGCCLELRQRGLITRAGITLGILFVGAVGSAQRRVYTAQGDDMNLAAHLMQRAALGEILVSGRVRNDVMDRYTTSSPMIVATKGHARGIPVARVLVRGSRAERHTPAQQRYLPDAAALIGHERERRAFEATAEAARAGKPGLLLVEGESGIGKSCMLQDLFLRWVGAGLTGFSAECSSGGAGVPLLAWRPIFADLCGLDEGAPPRVQLAHLELALAGLPRAAAVSEAPLLAAALGVGQARLDSASALDADGQARLVALANDLVAAQVARGPLLIMLEDVHWADDVSLALAAELIARAPTGGPYPLLIVMSHRPLDGPPPAPLERLRAHPTATRVSVGRLSSDEITAMIRAQLGVSAVHDDLRQHVERHTEGQPLFIKEYLRVLRQHDLVRVEQDSARLVRSYVTVQVSSSAQGVIQARVDRLDLATRLTLKVAAVLGRSFSLKLLAIVHPARPRLAALREQLDTLAALQIVDLELEDPERVYRFKFGITHEVAYTSLLFGQRRQLHAAVADWYESVYAAEIAAGGAVMAVYDVLIEHLGRAEQWARQAHYCRLAAEQAARQSATAAALRYVDQALLSTRDGRARAALLLLRVAVNERVGNYTGQADDLNELAALIPEGDRELVSIYAHYFRLRYLLATGVAPAVAALAPRAIRRVLAAEHEAAPAERQALTALRAALTETLGAARAALGDSAAARTLYLRALDLCRTANAPDTGRAAPAVSVSTRGVAARALDALGRLALGRGDLDHATLCLRQALDLARAAADWCIEARAREGLGRVHLAHGELSAALDEVRAALSTSNAVGDRAGQAMALRLMAAIAAAQDDYAAASRDAHYALAISAGARARVLEAALWDDVATYAAAQGQPEQAAAARDEAERTRKYEGRCAPGVGRGALRAGRGA